MALYSTLGVTGCVLDYDPQKGVDDGVGNGAADWLEDESGNGNHLTSAALGWGAPALIHDGRNGAPLWRFGFGVNSMARSPGGISGLPTAADAPWTIFTLMDHPSGSFFGGWAMGQDSALNGLVIRGHNSHNIYAQIHSGAAPWYDGRVEHGLIPLEVQFDGSDIRIWSGGVFNLRLPASITFIWTSLQIGANWFGASARGDFWQGPFGMFDSALSASDMQTCREALAEVYKIGVKGYVPSSLPNSLIQTTEGLVIHDDLDQAGSTLDPAKWVADANALVTDGWLEPTAGDTFNHDQGTPLNGAVVQARMVTAGSTGVNQPRLRVRRDGGGATYIYYPSTSSGFPWKWSIAYSGGSFFDVCSIIASGAWTTNAMYLVQGVWQDSFQRLWRIPTLICSGTDATENGNNVVGQMNVYQNAGRMAVYRRFLNRFITVNDMPAGAKIVVRGKEATESGGVATLDMGGYAGPFDRIDVFHSDGTLLTTHADDEGVALGSVYDFSGLGTGKPPDPGAWVVPIAAQVVDQLLAWEFTRAAGDPADGTIEYYVEIGWAGSNWTLLRDWSPDNTDTSDLSAFAERTDYQLRVKSRYSATLVEGAGYSTSAGFEINHAEAPTAPTILYVQQVADGVVQVTLLANYFDPDGNPWQATHYRLGLKDVDLSVPANAEIDERSTTDQYVHTLAATADPTTEKRVAVAFEDNTGRLSDWTQLNVSNPEVLGDADFGEFSPGDLLSVADGSFDVIGSQKQWRVQRFPHAYAGQVVQDDPLSGARSQLLRPEVGRAAGMRVGSYWRNAVRTGDFIIGGEFGQDWWFVLARREDGAGSWNGWRLNLNARFAYVELRRVQSGFDVWNGLFPRIGSGGLVNLSRKMDWVSFAIIRREDVLWSGVNINYQPDPGQPNYDPNHFVNYVSDVPEIHVLLPSGTVWRVMDFGLQSLGNPGGSFMPADSSFDGRFGLETNGPYGSRYIDRMVVSGFQGTVEAPLEPATNPAFTAPAVPQAVDTEVDPNITVAWLAPVGGLGASGWTYDLDRWNGSAWVSVLAASALTTTNEDMTGHPSVHDVHWRVRATDVATAWVSPYAYSPHVTVRHAADAPVVWEDFHD